MVSAQRKSYFKRFRDKSKKIDFFCKDYLWFISISLILNPIFDFSILGFKEVAVKLALSLCLLSVSIHEHKALGLVNDSRKNDSVCYNQELNLLNLNHKSA